MAKPLETNDALENWKRYGGDDKTIASYVANTGSSQNLTPQQVPAPTQAAPAAPPPGTGGYGGAAPMPMNPNLDGAPPSLASTQQIGKWVEENKPVDPGEYTGGDPHRTYWGGSLVGGSATGVEDYTKWSSEHAQYGEALRKWREQYDEWERMKKAREQPSPAQQPAPGPQSSAQPQTYWGPASTQQQNLGQTPYTAPTSPYAVPGQRTPAAQPGAGPVQKPDKSVNKVNPRYEGVL